MNLKSRCIRALAVAAPGVPSLACGQAGSPWRFAAVLDGDFPALGGTTTLPSSGGSSAVGAVSADIDQIPHNLQFTFRGFVEAVRDTWGIHGDLVHLDLGRTETASRAGAIGGRFFAPHHLDVGTGESGSNWRASVGIGHRFDWARSSAPGAFSTTG